MKINHIIFAVSVASKSEFEVASKTLDEKQCNRFPAKSSDQMTDH